MSSLKLPYNVIQSIFSFSPRWCHLPLGGITSPYGKNDVMNALTPPHKPLQPNDVIFQNGEWRHTLGDCGDTNASQRPLRPYACALAQNCPFPSTLVDIILYWCYNQELWNEKSSPSSYALCTMLLLWVCMIRLTLWGGKKFSYWLFTLIFWKSFLQNFKYYFSIWLFNYGFLDCHF